MYLLLPKHGAKRVLPEHSECKGRRRACLQGAQSETIEPILRLVPRFGGL